MPQYLVWCPDLGHTEQDAKSYAAATAVEAAEEWARRRELFEVSAVIDRADWSERVQVRAVHDQTTHTMQVGAWTQRHVKARFVGDGK